MFTFRCRCWNRDLPRAVVLFWAVAWSAGLVCHPAAGQAVAPAEAPAAETPPAAAKPKIRELPVNENLFKIRNQVMQTLRNGFGDPLPEAQFDQFYNRYFLARWTVEENRAALAGYRGDLQIHFRNAQNTAVHDYLNALVLKAMRYMAASPPHPDGEFYPATRVNAMLMVGELNADEKVPVPLPEALAEALVPTAADAQQPGAVRVAAMVGILRHAELGAINTSEARQQVTGAMLALAGSQPAPNQAGDGWMRAQAAEVLGYLGAVGNGGSAVRALAGIVANAELPLSTRSTAAEALGKLNYQGVTGLNATALAGALAQLAVDAFYAEGDAFSRHRLQRHLNAAAAGLNGHPAAPGRGGIASLATAEPHRTAVAALQRATKAMVDTANSRLDDNEAAVQINGECAKLEEELGKLENSP